MNLFFWSLVYASALLADPVKLDSGCYDQCIPLVETNETQTQSAIEVPSADPVTAVVPESRAPAAAPPARAPEDLVTERFYEFKGQTCETHYDGAGKVIYSTAGCPE